MSDLLQQRQAAAEAVEPSPTPFVHGVKQLQRADLVALQKSMPTYTLSDAERAQILLTQRVELRQLGAIESLRAWSFWGPFWATIAAGAITAILYFIAVTVLAASTR